MAFIASLAPVEIDAAALGARRALRGRDHRDRSRGFRACRPANPEDWLSGYIPDLPTPFDAKGEIDLNAFRVLCERQIEAGVPALVVCEAAGETSTLSPAEQESVTRTAVEIAGGRARVIAGAGSNSTSHAIELTKARKLPARMRSCPLCLPFQPCRSTTPHVQPGYPVRRSDTPCSAAPLGMSSLASEEYSFEYAQPHCNRDEFNVS